MLRKGAILHGVYRIDSYLSSGGFGNTYVATNMEFEETVAIKEFFMRGVTQRDANNTTVSVSNSENIQQFEEQKEKFKKEARRIRKLKNEHIVCVHDLFEENGTAYYVMDYIDGESLAERLKRTQQPIGEKEVKTIFMQVLDALDTVHREGIWHLDLKPANIMIDRQGNTQLIDFGASKQQSHKGGATTSTAVSYTNGYAPREQMEQNLDKFGPWTDFYALGATLYTLLTNHKPPMPSDIDDDQSSDKHLSLPMANVSVMMQSIILKLMSTNRLRRPQNVSEIRDLLQNSKLDKSSFNDVSYFNPKTEDEETIVRSNPPRYDVKIPVNQPKEKERSKLIYVALFLFFVVIVLFIIAAFQNRNNPAVDTENTVTEQVSEELTLEEIVAKAKAESAYWTIVDWKYYIKAAMASIAPIFKKIGEMQQQIGDDPEKAAAALGDLAKLMEEMEPMDKLYDELDSIAQTSEIGKAVMADTVWAKQVAEELGIADIDI